MKKTIMGLAVLAMSIMPAIAATQNQSNDNTVKVEKSVNGHSKGDKSGKDKKDRKDKKDKKGKDKKDFKGKKDGKFAGKCKNGGCKKVYNDSVNLESLNLNENQKAQVKALNEARRASVRELKENARKARVEGDNSFVFDGTQFEIVQSKYLKDLRAVLTSDQYVQFLENNYINGGFGHKGPKPEMRKGDRKPSIDQKGRTIKPSKKDMKSIKSQKSEASVSTVK